MIRKRSFLNPANLAESFFYVYVGIFACFQCQFANIIFQMFLYKISERILCHQSIIKKTKIRLFFELANEHFAL